MDFTTIFCLLFALLIRWIVSFHPYSGQGKPPMFGDYEAQRHWMEITLNLPVEKWYTNSTENDLLYWGLDYPPLTAYHSFLMGKISHHINPEWVMLNTSRGHESYHHKLFMRSTVLISDILIYLTAIFYYWIKLPTLGASNMASHYFFQSLIIPSLILIDYGHFQYNCITLGLFIWTIICLHRGMDLIATVFFCLALNYKQMALYYSLPIFFYLLKRCLQQKSLISSASKFLVISSAVLVTFGSLWIPYIRQGNIESVIQVVRRIFPLNRGIYEDKVANFWYCLSVLVKVKTFFGEDQLAMASGVLTLISALPSCYIVFKQNTLKQLKLSLFVVSLGFFLFSFQVHEKTILFANIALMLLSDLYPFMTIWFSLISTFSLQPLLDKDNLMIPYFTLPIIYIIISQNSLFRINNKLINRLFLLSMFGALVLSISSLIITPPERYPHIHSLLNCLYSFGHFLAFYFYFLLEQISNHNQYKYSSHQNRLYNVQSMTFIRPRPKFKDN